MKWTKDGRLRRHSSERSERPVGGNSIMIGTQGGRRVHKDRLGASSNAQRDGSPKGNQTKAGSEVDANPRHKQTPAEAEAVNAIVAAQKKRGPRLKVVVTGENSVRTEVDHPDGVIGVVALMRALGTTDFDFYNGLINQLLNASREKEASESGTNFMLSVIKGIEPRDQIEAMLAAQMAAFKWP
jgi:hypothetical protein